MFCLKKIQALSWVLGSFHLHLSAHVLVHPQPTSSRVLPPSLHRLLPLCPVSVLPLSPQHGICASFSPDPKPTSNYCLPSPHPLVLWEPPLLPHLPVIPQPPTIFKSPRPHHSTGGSVGGESACSTGDLGSIPGLGSSPGEGNGNPFQFSCLGNPMDRGAGEPQSMELSRPEYWNG